jgi:hypothetical protein
MKQIKGSIGGTVRADTENYPPYRQRHLRRGLDKETISGWTLTEFSERLISLWTFQGIPMFNASMDYTGYWDDGAMEG